MTIASDLHSAVERAGPTMSSVLDAAVISLSLEIIDDAPHSDPRWAEASSSSEARKRRRILGIFPLRRRAILVIRRHYIRAFALENSSARSLFAVPFRRRFSSTRNAHESREIRLVLGYFLIY